ncbi:MAG: 50S ribosomal protein L25 [Candidatus Saccharimonadales bacterium]
MASLDEPVLLKERTHIRKGLQSLRAEGLVPAVIHNHGQESIHVMGNEMEFAKLYKAAGKHHPLQLSVGGKDYLALIKDVHFNPVKRRMQHVVFQAIRRNEKVEAEVPIHLEGEIPAEKIGLMVLHQLDNVQVEALPQDLPDQLVADATKLAELHDKITVADLSVPAGVTILTEADHPIATVVETKAQLAEEAEEAPEEAGEEAETTEADADGAKEASEKEGAEPGASEKQ